jgi:hypothetical protein
MSPARSARRSTGEAQSRQGVQRYCPHRWRRHPVGARDGRNVNNTHRPGPVLEALRDSGNGTKGVTHRIAATARLLQDDIAGFQLVGRGLFSEVWGW